MLLWIAALAVSVALACALPNARTGREFGAWFAVLLALAGLSTWAYVH